MPIKCRVGVCGFDPILVKGYVKTGARALWWFIPDEVFEEYKVKPGDSIIGTLHVVYDYKGEKTHAPDEPFEWPASKETGLAIVLPPDTITKYKLTEFHFLELTIDSIKRTVVKNGQEEKEEIKVYLGQEVKSRKWWPEEKMKLHYYVSYI